MEDLKSGKDPDGGWWATAWYRMPPPSDLSWLKPYGELRDIGMRIPITNAIVWHLPLAPTDDPAKRKAYLDAVMEHMTPFWRERWCNPNLSCACLGCSNRWSGGRLMGAGFTREEWQGWWDARGGLPPPHPAPTSAVRRYRTEPCFQDNLP